MGLGREHVTSSTLDFICIGAAKSATTTLFELLKDHPNISMPLIKEAPFFSDQQAYEKGLDWYIKANFDNPTTAPYVRGTITPQYMIGEGDINYVQVADRIREHLPNVKLIAIVRHPIKRAYSHYRMLKKRGYDTRSFDEAVDANIEGQTTLKNYSERDSAYLEYSKYGKILQEYFKRFPSEQILVLTTEELRDNPADVLKKVTSFLGVPYHAPAKADIITRKGGSKPRIHMLTPGFLYGLPYVKETWQRTPYTLRRRVEYSLNLWNTSPDDEQFDHTSDTYHKLVSYFENDVMLFKKLSGITPKWRDWN